MYHLSIGRVVKLRDLDLKRVIWDVEYRREVIAFLNRRSAAGKRKKEPKLVGIPADGGSNDDPRRPDEKAA